jgi:hypothetical protein
MKCDDVKSLLADRLDDLLDAAETAEIDRHLEECEVCAEGSRDLRGRLALLYRADADLHPPPELRERILVAAMPRPRIGLAVLLRYAAVFLAGVGVAFAVLGAATGVGLNRRLDQQRPRRAASSPIQYEPGGDPVEPGRQGAVLPVDPIAVPQEPDEGLLAELFGEFRVPGHADQVGEDRLAVRVPDRVEVLVHLPLRRTRVPHREADSRINE